MSTISKQQCGLWTSETRHEPRSGLYTALHQAQDRALHTEKVNVAFSFISPPLLILKSPETVSQSEAMFMTCWPIRVPKPSGVYSLSWTQKCKALQLPMTD